MRRHAVELGVAGTLILAATTGVFASMALSAGSATEPQRTVTITAGGQGATGPAGPAGPKGESGATGPAGPGGGAESCPSGSTFGKVVVIQQGKGPTAFLTCLVDEP